LPPTPKKIKPSLRSVLIMLVVALAGMLLVLRAWNLWPFNSSVVTTDNAYVRGAVTVLAPQVNGYVTEVLVKDYEQVKAGQRWCASIAAAMKRPSPRPRRNWPMPRRS
jgi:multidrug resistance efflux pump